MRASSAGGTQVVRVEAGGAVVTCAGNSSTVSAGQLLLLHALPTPAVALK